MQANQANVLAEKLSRLHTLFSWMFGMTREMHVPCHGMEKGLVATRCLSVPTESMGVPIAMQKIAQLDHSRLLSTSWELEI